MRKHELHVRGEMRPDSSDARLRGHPRLLLSCSEALSR